MKTQYIKNIYLFFFFFIINIFFTVSMITFEMKSIITDSELDILNIKCNLEEQCSNWIPSLFNPIMLVPSYFDFSDALVKRSRIKTEILSNEEIGIFLFNFTFLNKYNIYFGREIFGEYVQKCYFGLMKTINSNGDIFENQIILNKLKDDLNIDKKIFSFDKWFIGSSEIKSNFYLGDIHENFLSKNGLIGTCLANKTDIYWGCKFNVISFKNNNIDLKDENGNLYNIYFSSENYNIKMPLQFEEKFINLTNGSCKYEEDEKDLDYRLSYLTCRNFFNNENFASISLIDDKMNITIEIDNIIRFSEKNDSGKDKARIQFEDINYFIFPLIMFKNFHIQFDAENNIISFYTTDKSILQLKNENNEKKEGSSKGLKIFLIILLILIILALGFGIFVFIRKKKGYNNIIEDEKSFQNMDEKRLF